jgi:mitochondrial fission protein ELM1
LSESAAHSIWIATDGTVGNEKQCLALAHYLPGEPEVFRVVLREPWNTLVPHFRQGGRRAITGGLRERLDGPLPDLLITAGRRATLVSTTVRRLSAGQTLTTHILDPRIDARHFDLLVCPSHDRTRGDSVIVTTGAPHCIDEQTLAAARQAWPDLAALPGPRVALLIGASNRAYRVDREYLERLVEAVLSHLSAGGSVLVTTSRRTEPELVAFVKQRFASIPGQVWTGPDDGINPYPGFLAWADRLFVTADSVNMLSEACGTGKPVHCEPPGPGIAKFQRFHQLMRDQGHVLPLDSLETRVQPLRETREVADRIAEQLALRATARD